MGNKGFLKFIAVALTASVIAACGGGGGPEFGGSTGGSTGGTTGTTTGGTTGTTGPVPASIKLIASSPSLPSSAVTSASPGAVTLTAIVKDSNNNLLADIPVEFSSDPALGTTCGEGGGVTQGGSTNASGTAQSVLSTSGDQSNQVITVTANAGGLSDSLNIPVTGTSVQVTGPSTLSSGASANYAIKLLDSAGNGIGNELVIVTSSLGNGLSSANFKTDSSGLITVQYTGSNGGGDTLTAVAACATGQKSIQVSSKSLSFSAPAANSEIDFGFVQALTVQLTPAVAGTTINFTTTRGTLSAPSAVTNGSGVATVNISQAAGANGAGGALVSATVNGENVSASLPVEFIAVSPTAIKLQANPGTVAVNTSAAITAEVRDADNNLVKNQRVNFSFEVGSDPVGDIVPGFAETDSQGRATVTYTASSTASAKDGVKIKGEVIDDSNNPIGVDDTVALTVGAQSLRIVLGTGNTVDTSGGATIYRLPYSVLVTDAGGNPPVAGTKVSLVVEPIAYQKGVHVFAPPWSPVYFINSASKQPPVSGFGCLNEDANRNGILDSGEDFNSNNNLDPGGVASVPASVSTDENGFAAFSITYQRDRAYWIQVRLTAIVTVAGTENREQQTFVLPGAASDFSSATVAPPGQISPYGTAANCAESEAGPFVGFTVDAQDAIAGNPVTVTVNLSRVTTVDVTVPFEFSGNLTRGTDYTTDGLSGEDTLSITAGDTTGSFTLLTNNPAPFGNSNVIITIDDPTNAQQGGTFIQQVNISN